MEHRTDSLQSVERAMAAIEILVHAGRPLTVREISERLGINRTTAHRLVNSLVRGAWVERCPAGGYQLSIKFLALGHVSNVQRNFILDIRPDLMQLSQRCRETIHVGVLDGHHVLHIDKIDSLETVGVSSRVGTRGVVHRTGLGKALLAHQPESVIQPYLQWARDSTGASNLADEPQFRQELHRIRENGFSLDDEDDSIGVRCIGVAVLGPDALPLFAISVTGPSPRFTRDVALTLAPELVRIGEKLSSLFGYQPESRNRLVA